MADDPDPHRLVRDHCDHIKQQPQWVSDAYDFNADKLDNCFHCHTRFLPFLQLGRISRHHCRLCGELVCKACTSKVSLPSRLEKKDKALSRVCHGCLLTVLARRVIAGEQSKPVTLRVTTWVWGRTQPSTEQEKGMLLPRVFYYPDWANVHDTAACLKCNLRTARRHHCRLCGFLFCGDCTEKRSGIPAAYDKKNKHGAQRICDYCRFCLARGWRFQQEGETPNSFQNQGRSGGGYAIRPAASSDAPLGYTSRNDPSAPSNGFKQLGPPSRAGMGMGAGAGGYASPVASASASLMRNVGPISPSSASSVPPPPASDSSYSAQQSPSSYSSASPSSRFGGGAAPSPTAAAAPAAPPPRPSPSAFASAASRPVPAIPGGGASAGAGQLPPPRPLNLCSHASCTAACEPPGGFCASHGATNSSLPKNTPVPFDVVVRLRWEDDPPSKLFAAVRIVGHADLHAINAAFLAQCPLLEPEASSFVYVCRGRAAAKMHWRMFEARFVCPDIVLKKLAPFDHDRCSPYRRANVAPAPAPAPVQPSIPARPAYNPLSPPSLPPGRPSSARSSPAVTRAPSPARNQTQTHTSLAASAATSAMPTREQLLAQSKPSRALVPSSSPPRASPVGTPRVSPKQQTRSIAPTTVSIGAYGQQQTPPPAPSRSSFNRGPPPAPAAPAGPPQPPISIPRPAGFGPGAAARAAAGPPGLPSAPPRKWPQVQV